MYETIDGNATKRDSRYLAITNAYLPGEDSVAQKMRESFDKVREGRMGRRSPLRLASRRTRPLLSRGGAHGRHPKIRGDAIWLRPETIIQSIQDGDMSPSRSRRMWLNQIVAEEDALYGPAEWDVLELKTPSFLPEIEIVLGFDGGSDRRRDRACGYPGFRPMSPSCWDCGRSLKCPQTERPRLASTSGPSPARSRLEVHEAFRLYNVQAFYADVALWESHITDWSPPTAKALGREGRWSDAIGWDMRSSLKRATMAHERLMRAVFDKKLFHNGDLAMRRHVLNARRRTNNFGISFGKESRESPARWTSTRL
jgi:hypothetical protein